MINPFKAGIVTNTIYGAYFGSHPQYPDSARMLTLDATSQGIKLRKIKTIAVLPWSEITGFDFSGEVMNGVYYATLSTRTGDIKLEIASSHTKKVGHNQFWANQWRKRLNRFKRYVVDHTSQPQSS